MDSESNKSTTPPERSTNVNRTEFGRSPRGRGRGGGGSGGVGGRRGRSYTDATPNKINSPEHSNGTDYGRASRGYAGGSGARDAGLNRSSDARDRLNYNNNNSRSEFDRNLRGRREGGDNRGARRDNTMSNNYRQQPPRSTTLCDSVQSNVRNFGGTNRAYNTNDSFRSRPLLQSQQQFDYYHQHPPQHQQYYHHTPTIAPPPSVLYNYSENFPLIESGVNALQNMCIGSGPISFRLDNQCNRQSNDTNRLFRDCITQWKPGQKCLAPWSDGRFYTATVLSLGPADMCSIRYDDYGNSSSVPQGMMMMPQLSSIHD